MDIQLVRESADSQFGGTAYTLALTFTTEEVSACIRAGGGLESAFLLPGTNKFPGTINYEPGQSLSGFSETRVITFHGDFARKVSAENAIDLMTWIKGRVSVFLGLGS